MPALPFAAKIVLAICIGVIILDIVALATGWVNR